MFDNQPTGQSNGNAPMADDIFSGLDNGAPQVQPAQPQAQFSPQELGQINNPDVSVNNSGNETNNKRLMIVGGIVVGLLILAIGIWLILMGMKGKSAVNSTSQTTGNPEKTGLVVPATEKETAPVATNVEATVSNTAVVEKTTAEQSTSTNENTETSASLNNEGSSAPASVTETAPTTAEAIPEAVRQAATKKTDTDTDGDGLTDEEEGQLGTYSDRSDTDGDGLNDFEELKAYFTNPKNPDTDADGFKDGDEVKNGYNPSGIGKLIK